jgi:SAM-dependent methyltransferase
LRRKKFFLKIFECRVCSLRYRSPKDTVTENEKFYQTEYKSPVNTDLPSDREIEEMKASGIGPKDFSPYIGMMKALGLKEGSSVLDYGCSWGYGSWLLQRAGFDVSAYDVSRPRARFAVDKLGCKIADIDNADLRFDCVFSRHVIEHLPDPNHLWKLAARVLDRGGWFIGLCPNGNPEREKLVGLRKYDSECSRVHPLYLTPDYVRYAAARHGFETIVHTEPYDMGLVEQFKDAPRLQGEELAFIARKL